MRVVATGSPENAKLLIFDNPGGWTRRKGAWVARAQGDQKSGLAVRAGLQPRRIQELTTKSDGSVNDYDEHRRRSILEKVDVDSKKLNIPDLDKASQDDTKAVTNGFDSWLHNVVGEVGNAEFKVQGSARFSKFFIIDEGSLQSLAARTTRSGNSRGKKCSGQSLCYSSLGYHSNDALPTPKLLPHCHSGLAMPASSCTMRPSRPLTPLRDGFMMEQIATISTLISNWQHPKVQTAGYTGTARSHTFHTEGPRHSSPDAAASPPTNTPASLANRTTRSQYPSYRARGVYE
ncbi:hypothetical protein V493_07891 [Pseudogymnoascus sp. VKM F-4281 (FW-2241)]|nr:hypothetical protein V493_07891 [Pseudogymnoascus sp. VKM F-4281 (FW-2241)]